MRRKSLLILIVALHSVLQATAQTSAIDSIATKYRNWLTGEGVDYSDPAISQRYSRFLNSGNGARNLSGYDLVNPGPVWNFAVAADQSAYEVLVEQKLIRLVFLYQIKGPAASPNAAYHSVPLRDTILGIFNYLKTKGINQTTDFEVSVSPSLESTSIGNAPALRSSAYTTAVLLMKDELAAAGEFGHHLGAMANLTSFIDQANPNFTFTYPGFNTDGIRASIQQRFCYILSQDDTSSTRAADMLYLKNFINNALQSGYGWADCIKPDGITYHHRGVYANAYGVDALQQAAILSRILKSTSYQLDAASMQNVKNAVMAYRKFSLDFTMPRGLAGRFPTNTSSLNTLRPALAYLYIADPTANADAGQEFLRLWNISAPHNLALQRDNILSINMIYSLGGMQDMVNLLNAGLAPATELTAGHFGFPYAGLSVHKYNGWQGSVKGTSKHIWHFEKGTGENLLGAYTAAGAMEMLTNGNPVTPDSNGLSFNGWDWAHIPGTTVANVPFAVLASYTMRQMSGKNFLAHAALDSNGVFAMDYRDINSATGMSALKTCFFFKDKILCLGSNIKDNNGTYPVHTTLFQTSFPAGNNSLVNGTTVSCNSYTFNQTGGGLWATDAIGNGFVIPASAYNSNPVTVTRSNQTSPNQANTANTTGDFVKAFIDHGTAPVAGTYQYGVQLQGGAGTAAFLTNFNNYFLILKQDSQAHVVKYVPDSIYSYVMFDTATALSEDLLKKTNKPAVIMTQQLQQGNKVKISLTNPNLGLLAPDEVYTWSQISGTPSRLHRVPKTDTVKITLRGTWQPDIPQSHVSVSAGDTTTDVFFYTKNGITEQATLIRTTPLPVGIAAFRTRRDGCAAVLEWELHENRQQVRSIAVERSIENFEWEQIALLGPDALHYRDETEAMAYYRISLCSKDNVCRYSSATYARRAADCNGTLVRLYPNPTRSVLHIDATGTAMIETIHIADVYGCSRDAAVVTTRKGHSAVMDMKQLPAGVYLVTVNGSTYKVVKQ